MSFEAHSLILTQSNRPSRQEPSSREKWNGNLVCVCVRESIQKDRNDVFSVVACCFVHCVVVSAVCVQCHNSPQCSDFSRIGFLRTPTSQPPFKFIALTRIWLLICAISMTFMSLFFGHLFPSLLLETWTNIKPYFSVYRSLYIFFIHSAYKFSINFFISGPSCYWYFGSHKKGEKKEQSPTSQK